jgi:hypothetical protein
MHRGPNGRLKGAASPLPARGATVWPGRIGGVPNLGTDGGPGREAAGTAPRGARTGPARPAGASCRPAGLGRPAHRRAVGRESSPDGPDGRPWPGVAVAGCARARQGQGPARRPAPDVRERLPARDRAGRRRRSPVQAADRRGPATPQRRYGLRSSRRLWPSGGGRPSPTSRTSRSPSEPSPHWRSFGSRRSRIGSTRTSSRVVPRISCPNWNSSSGPIRSESGRTAC